MSDISRLLQIANGVVSGVDLTSSNLITSSVTVGGSSGTLLSKAVLDSLISYSEVLTTAGDILYEDASPAAARLPIGSDGQVLTVVSGLPAWASTSAAANQALSNLSSVAINTSLLPGTDDSISLGSASKSWLAANIHTLADGSSVTSIDLYNRLLADSSGLTSVNYGSRALVDASAATQLSWSTSGVEFNQLTASTVPYLSSGKVLTSSAVTPTQLGYLSGASGTTGTGNLVFSASPTFSGTVDAAAMSLSSTLNMNSNQINNLADGSASGDAVNLGQLQAAIAGLTWKGPAQAYANSDVALTGGATLTIDGYSAQNGDLVILGNQTTASQNGEYAVSGIGTAYVLTANGLPNAVGDAWLILNGTVYADSAFVANAAVPAATFTEFAGPTAYTFTAPLQLSGRTVSITQSTTSTDGYLSSTDWNTFNGKQPAGNYITALTGDASASGPGSAALTLATVNSNVGSFGGASSVPSFTVNAKGLITAASATAVVAPAGTLSGTTLNSTVVSSSLTSVGTIGTGVWQGTAVAIAYGGTGQVTASAAFAALSPLTTKGDIIYEDATPAPASLGIGSTGQVLTVVSGLPAWATLSITPAEIALTDNHILVGNASNVAADVAMSGDVAIVASGATTIQAGAVTASKLGTVTDGITTDQSGSGSTIEVLQAPKLANSLNATGTFAANTSYIVRWAEHANGDTAGTVYAADNGSAANAYAIGIAISTAGISVSGSIKVVSEGLYTLGSSDSAFSSTVVGLPVYLTTSGAFSTTAPTSAGTAVFRLGIVASTSQIWVQPSFVGVN